MELGGGGVSTKTLLKGRVLTALDLLLFALCASTSCLDMS